MNGTQNLWIVKPGGLSRGRKIRIFDSYQEICQYAELSFISGTSGQIQVDYSGAQRTKANNKAWVAQKYIENPLIILNRKFDIRVWVVVSSWNPLKVYYYNQPYIRFTSQDYDKNNIQNMFSHLTNNAITSKQIRMADDKSFDKIPGNMWYLSQMKQFLNHKFAKAEPVV